MKGPEQSEQLEQLEQPELKEEPEEPEEPDEDDGLSQDGKEMGWLGDSDLGWQMWWLVEAIDRSGALKKLCFDSLAHVQMDDCIHSATLWFITVRRCKQYLVALVVIVIVTDRISFLWQEAVKLEGAWQQLEACCEMCKYEMLWDVVRCHDSLTEVKKAWTTLGTFALWGYTADASMPQVLGLECWILSEVRWSVDPFDFLLQHRLVDPGVWPCSQLSGLASCGGRHCRHWCKQYEAMYSKV